jgi:hypothetical protein
VRAGLGLTLSVLDRFEDTPGRRIGIMTMQRSLSARYLNRCQRHLRRPAAIVTRRAGSHLLIAGAVFLAVVVSAPSAPAGAKVAPVHSTTSSCTSFLSTMIPASQVNPFSVGVLFIPKCAKGFSIVTIAGETFTATASASKNTIVITAGEASPGAIAAGSVVDFIPSTAVINCVSVIGTVTFSPGLTTTPQTVTETISLKISACSTGSAVMIPAATYSTTKSNIKAASLVPETDCSATSGFLKAVDKLAVAWVDPKSKSTVTFSGSVASGGSTLGWSAPGPSGTGSVTGSYAGSDSGASATMSLVSSETPAQFAAACATKKGLKSVKIVSGSISLQ